MFEFISTNGHLNVHIKESLTDNEQIVFNIIRDKERITKSGIAIRIGKSEKSGQRFFSSLIRSIMKNIEYYNEEIIVNKFLNESGYVQNKIIGKTKIIVLNIIRVVNPWSKNGEGSGMYIQDIDGGYSHQPLFVPTKETDNSSLSSRKEM